MFKSTVLFWPAVVLVNKDFIGSDSYRTWGNGFKLKEGRMRLNVRKKFCTQKVMRPALLHRAVGAPSLGVLKTRLDGALGSLSWWGAPSPWQGVIFKVPSFFVKALCDVS